jgi:hypothetical protein
MIKIVMALFFIMILFLFTSKEGFEEENDYMNLITESLLSAIKDSRMRPSQKIAIEDALKYAEYIKNI